MMKSGFVIVDEGPHKVGLKDAKGNTLLECAYDKILDFDSDGYVRFIKKGVYGTLDLQGNPAIPLELGLTHLGVFHGGTARACKGNRWGLVDVHGNEVGDFDYKQINAHYGKGYKAIDKENFAGFLAEDGTFTSSGKKVKPKSPYVEIAVYHNGVAPAHKKSQNWVFIDKEQNRINDYEYLSMDTVLRHGLYEVSTEEGHGLAFYDGTPLTDQWFSYPVHFEENGLAPCCRLHRDKEGNSVTRLGGQPRYDYGILKMDGTFLFPMDYHTLHWNDYHSKDCWFAEDERAAYLLYADGTRKIYNKRSIYRGPWHECIPAEEYNNDISEKMLGNTYMPETILSRGYTALNKDAFFYRMINWNQDGSDDLKFYYRDTDVPLDPELYKKGTLLRAGEFLEASSRLLKPVHKTRFLIATRWMLSAEEVQSDSQSAGMKIPFKENVLCPDACFLVHDVQKYAGVTQIVLLQIPRQAVSFAKTYDIDLGDIDLYAVGEEISKETFEDLKEKCESQVHGHSLNQGWVEAMSRPVGLNDRQKPYSPYEEYSLPTDKEYGWEERCLNYFRYYAGQEVNWKKNDFMKIQPNTLKLVVGDITKLDVEAIVNAANPDLLGGKGVDGAIHKAAGRLLLEECRKLGGCPTGQSKMTDAYKLPCLKVIHTVGPYWKGGDQNEAQLLDSCYDTALKLATENRLKSIAFPCISTGAYHYPKEEAAKIALNAITRNLKSGKCLCDIILCCYSQADAEVYMELLGKNSFGYLS